MIDDEPRRVAERARPGITGVARDHEQVGVASDLEHDRLGAARDREARRPGVAEALGGGVQERFGAVRDNAPSARRAGAQPTMRTAATWSIAAHERPTWSS